METAVTFGSVCTGIGGFDLGFERAGMECLWTVEIDDRCNEVLDKHFPNAKRYRDILSVREQLEPVDVLCGGTPCQGFSIAGLRSGLADERSNLALEFIRIADRINPRIIVWENVPGVLSDNKNAFGCFLAALVGCDSPLVPTKECGGRWTNSGMVVGPKRSAAWRILDSQYFGLAQRRERVFLVADTGTGCAQKILLEPESVRRNFAPRRTQGKGTSADIAPSLTASGTNVKSTGDTRGQDPVIAVFDTVIPIQEIGKRQSGNSMNGVGHGKDSDPMFTLQRSAVHGVCVNNTGQGFYLEDEVATPLRSAIGEAQRSTLISEVSPTLDSNHNRKFGSNQWVNNGFAIVEPTHDLAPCPQERDSKGQDSNCDKAMVIESAIGFDRTTSQVGGSISSTLRRCGAKSEGVNDGKADVSCVAVHENQRGEVTISETSGALKVGGGKPGQGYPCVAFQQNQSGDVYQSDIPGALSTNQNATGRGTAKILSQYKVRRLTPNECAILSGFPPSWNDWLKDSPRYAQFGNCCNVPVCEWIGRRIVSAFNL